MEYHILSVEDRIQFFNELISHEIEIKNESNWMNQECVYSIFYTPKLFGHDTDEKVHAFMDTKQVPRKVELGLWQAYLDAEE